MLNWPRNKFAKPWIGFVTVAVLFLQILIVSASYAKDVTTWVYHDFPPFVIDAAEQKGLSFELADRLTAMSDGAYVFKVEVIGRGRLNHLVENKADGIVLWTNNLWFGDPGQEKFLWSQKLFHDRDAVISPTSAPIEFTTPDALIGRQLAGMRGHRLHGVDELVAEGLIERVDLGSEQQVVQFIAFARSDVSIMADLAARYYVAELGLQERVHFSSRTLSTFDRIILVQPQLVDEHAFIVEALRQLRMDPEWKSRLESYGVQPDQS